MRRVTFVVNSRANYARIKTAIRESIKHSQLEVKVVVGASGLLYRYGDVSRIIENDGISISNKLYSVVEGDEPISMVKTTALAMLALADEFQRTKPDIVVTVADRYETIATAIAASYMNIPLAHTQGGEITGSIDDSVRHAITRLAHLHFPASAQAEANLSRMGESQDSIFRIGCPSIDLALENQDLPITQIMENYHGVGAELEFDRPYILVSQHPDTLEYEESREQINQTLQAVYSLGEQVVWLWPNVDSGSDAISKRLREFREEHPKSRIRFYRNFSADHYINVLKNASCIVGNSSSGIREAGFLGRPSVNIGNRQRGRERPKNVLSVDYDSKLIAEAITSQMKVSAYSRDLTYGDGKSGARMANILATCDLSIRKKTLYS